MQDGEILWFYDSYLNVFVSHFMQVTYQLNTTNLPKPASWPVFESLSTIFSIRGICWIRWQKYVKIIFCNQFHFKLSELEQELCSLQSPQDDQVQNILQTYHQQVCSFKGENTTLPYFAERKQVTYHQILNYWCFPISFNVLFF